MLAGLKSGSIDWGQIERNEDLRRGVYLGWLDPVTYKPLPIAPHESADEAQEQA